MAEHHKDRGRAWQGEIEAMLLRYYQEQRIVGWIKNEPVRNLGDTPHEVVAKGKGAPDYTVQHQDFALYVEAKDWSTKPWWPLTQVSPWQAERLEAMDKARTAGSFVLLRFHGQAHLLPWREISELYYAEAKRYRPTWGQVDGADFLGAALAFLGAP